MPRRLSDHVNTLAIRDNISGGSEVVLFYTMPSTEDRVAYLNESIFKKRGNVDIRIGETRLKYGVKILAGIREGDFEIPKDGKYVPLSSSPDSRFYDPEWKNHLEKYAPDILLLLAAYVFEAPAEIIPDGNSEKN